MPWPAGDGFAWLSGKAHVVALARTIVLGERGHPREALRAAAYTERLDG